MLYPICTCGELLSNKQLVYEEKMKKLCDEIGVDFNMVSQGETDKNETYKKKRADKELDYIRRNYGHLLRKDPQYNPNLSFFGTNYDVIRKSEFARL